MIDFLNTLINTDFSAISAQEVADWFGSLLDKLFAYVAKVMEI